MRIAPDAVPRCAPGPKARPVTGPARQLGIHSESHSHLLPAEPGGSADLAPGRPVTVVAPDRRTTAAAALAQHAHHVGPVATQRLAQGLGQDASWTNAKRVSLHRHGHPALFRFAH